MSCLTEKKTFKLNPATAWCGRYMARLEERLQWPLASWFAFAIKPNLPCALFHTLDGGEMEMQSSWLNFLATGGMLRVADQ